MFQGQDVKKEDQKSLSGSYLCHMFKETKKIITVNHNTTQDN